MASNKFFTLMVVPEKSQQVKKIVIPSYVLKASVVILAFALVLSVVMVLDYANVMNQISENKKLKVENRHLRESVQVFKEKLVNLESTVDRVKTFTAKLRIITNIEDQKPNASTLPSTHPLTPIAPTPNAPVSTDIETIPVPMNQVHSQANPQVDSETDTDLEFSEATKNTENKENTERKHRHYLLAALTIPTPEASSLTYTATSAFVETEFKRLTTTYDEVYRFAETVEQEVQYILEQLGEKRTLIASTPTRLPTLGYITSEYGVRMSPFDGRKKMHEGIDIAAPYGEPIISPADGVIVFAGVKPGYGKMIEIDHGNGLETLYAHTSRIYVKSGEKVRRNQKIAAVGNSGHSTGPHLHYEVRANGLPIDPCWYILDVPTFCKQT